MYKSRNTESMNGIRETRGIEEYCIPRNVTKHSGECRQIFRGIS